MDASFWLEKWQTNKIGFNQSSANPLLQKYFPALNLTANARVFVPLCGKSIDMLWLAAQGYQVIGIELSQKACQTFFEENDISYTSQASEGFIHFKSENITLIAGDFFHLTSKLIGDIDAVYDRAALIALPLKMRKDYAKFLSSLIFENTQMLLITTCYDQNEMQVPPFSISRAEVNNLYKNDFDITPLHTESFKKMPSHLKKKGLVKAFEHVYQLTRI